MNKLIETYPPPALHCLMNILGSHDTERILTLLGSSSIPSGKDQMAESRLSEPELKQGIKLLKIAVLLQMTLPGIPCIYYGDEAGMEGWIDPFNRRCYPWGEENKEILDFYYFITKFRKTNKVFAEGKYRCLIHDKEVLVFERFDENARIILGVNLSQNDTILKLKEDMIEYTSNKKGKVFNIEKEDFLILLKK